MSRAPARRTPRPGCPARGLGPRSRPRSRRSGCRPARARESRQQVGDGRARPQPDAHPVLDQLRGCLRGESLLVVGAADHAPRDSDRSVPVDARIWLTAEGGEPRSVPLPEGRTVVGRDPDADLCIEDEAISWNHLEIESRGGVLMATDLDSRNGTALNGEPLDRPRRLRDGDSLMLGRHRLEISDPIPGRAGATVPAAEPGGRADRGGAVDRDRPGRPLPQRGRVRRPPGDPGGDRRGASRQRAHRPAAARRARRQTRRLRRGRARPAAPDRRPRHRARPRPRSLTRTGPDAARSGGADVVGAHASAADHRWADAIHSERDTDAQAHSVSHRFSRSSPWLCRPPSRRRPAPAAPSSSRGSLTTAQGTSDRRHLDAESG